MLGAPNRVLTTISRGGEIESVHRGSWAIVDTTGEVLDAGGDHTAPHFARSSSKSLQALPLIESGAAAAHSLGQRELAVALASHMAEPEHLEVVGAWMDRLGLDDSAFGCGPQPRPGVAEPQRIHNNCSGKHAGFLTLALHLGMAADDYLDADGVAQQQVRDTIVEMCDLTDDELLVAVDGCSAPTFRLPLHRLALGITRVANPAALPPSRRAAAEQLTSAAAAHPHLVGGHTERLDSALMAATGGRIFAKTGAEGLFILAEVGADRGLAIKIDDGNHRGCHLALIELIHARGWLTDDERASLGSWNDPTVRNFAGEDVGTITVHV